MPASDGSQSHVADTLRHGTGSPDPFLGTHLTQARKLHFEGFRGSIGRVGGRRHAPNYRAWWAELSQTRRTHRRAFAYPNWSGFRTPTPEATFNQAVKKHVFYRLKRAARVATVARRTSINPQPATHDLRKVLAWRLQNRVGIDGARARRQARSEGVELLKRTKTADVCRVARRRLFWFASVGVADADAFICDWTLREAIQLAGTGAKMILSHNTVCRMAREQSRRVLRWNPANPVSGKLYRSQRARAWPGGMWIVHADLFESHRMDERFEGWGCEDTEFLRRIPRRRLPELLFHSWHAKASKERIEQHRRLLRLAQ